MGGAIPKYLAWTQAKVCGSDKDGITNRTCQVWPTAGTGHEDNSWECCRTVRQTYRDHGGSERTVRNVDSALRGRASRGRASARLAFGATCLPLQDSILEPPRKWSALGFTPRLLSPAHLPPMWVSDVARSARVAAGLALRVLHPRKPFSPGSLGPLVTPPSWSLVFRLPWSEGQLRAPAGPGSGGLCHHRSGQCPACLAGHLSLGHQIDGFFSKAISFSSSR